MRSPLVLIMTWRIGRARTASRMANSSGCSVGSPPESCTRSGSPSLATSASSMRSMVASGSCFSRAGEEFGKADRTGQIAVLVDLDQRQAGMLLVVGAEPAIVGAAVFGAALQRQRPVAGLDVVLAELPIGGVGRDQRGLGAVLRAALLVPDLVVANLDLGRHQRAGRSRTARWSGPRTDRDAIYAKARSSAGSRGRRGRDHDDRIEKDQRRTGCGTA